MQYIRKDILLRVMDLIDKLRDGISEDDAEILLEKFGDEYYIGSFNDWEMESHVELRKENGKATFYRVYEDPEEDDELIWRQR